MISAPLKKAAADLLTRWGRTGLTIIGLAIGLFGLCSVLVAFVILSNDLNANFRATNPPNITIEAPAISAETQARIEALDGVAALERRQVMQGRIMAGFQGWMPLELFVVDDFAHMRVAKFYSERGAWPPPANGFLIERDGQFFIRNALGASMQIRLANGLDVRPTLAGFAYDPGQAPSRMDMVIYGYVSRATMTAWGASAGERLLIAARPGTNVRALAQQVEALVQDASSVAPRMQIFDSPQHPHQFQLNAMVALLAGVAAVSFMLCVTLIVNLIDSMMASEQRSIGVMRAIGGRSSQIAGAYLLGVGALGLIACAISIPYAVKMGHAMAIFVSRQLNFNLLSPAGPPWLLAGVMSVGFVLPILVAALRVARASRMPVRDALARIDPTSGKNAGAAATLPLPLIPRMAVRALLRKPRRAAFTAFALALGLAFFLTALNIRSSLWHTVDTERQSKPYDLRLTLREAYPRTDLQALLASTPNVARAEFWSGAEATLRDANGVQLSNPANVLAAPPQSWAVHPDLLAGSWLNSGAPDGIVVTQKFIDDEKLLRLGGVYRLRIGANTAPVRIIGVVREFGPGVIYAPAALVATLTGVTDRANIAFVQLRTSNFAQQSVGSNALEAALAAGNVRVASVITSALLGMIVTMHLDSIAQLLMIIAYIALAVAVLGLASSISVSVVERTREIGVLKALGGRSPAIAGLFLTEAALIAALGWVIAMVVAPLISRQIAAAFGAVIIQYPFDYAAYPWGGALALGVAVLVALGASALPIRAAIATTTRRALQSE